MDSGDWKLLALIGCCGLASVGGTAALLSSPDQAESCDLRIIEIPAPEIHGAPPVILRWRGEPSSLPPAFEIIKEGRIRFRDGAPLGMGTEESLFYPRRAASGVRTIEVSRGQTVPPPRLRYHR